MTKTQNQIMRDPDPFDELKAEIQGLLNATKRIIRTHRIGAYKAMELCSAMLRSWDGLKDLEPGNIDKVDSLIGHLLDRRDALAKELRRLEGKNQ